MIFDMLSVEGVNGVSHYVPSFDNTATVACCFINWNKVTGLANLVSKCPLG